MYLSKLALDPRHPQARRDLADRYEMHRTLARVFAPDAGTPPPRFLWRIERGALPGQPVMLLVQAAVPGNWSVVEDMRGYAPELAGDKPFDAATFVQAGGRYRFRIEANATVTRERKRYGLHREEDQLSWLGRQGERHGFTVLACVRGATERISVRQGRSGHRISVDAVQFDGLLEVGDAAAVRAALQAGLGHAKALGLGLLSLGRA